LIEVRWHGRGGQGVVRIVQILAWAGLIEGRYVQGFPEFGPERQGAPVTGFNRISNEPILLHSQIYEPDYVVVLDQALLGKVDVFRGLKDAGTAIVNSTRDGEEISKQFRIGNAKIFTLDASKTALDIFGRLFPNTPMLGALVKVTGIVKLESAIQAISDYMDQRLHFGSKLIELNIEATQRGYESIFFNSDGPEFKKERRFLFR